MLYPSKLSYQAFESIVKAMGPDVQISEDDRRVCARAGLIDRDGTILSVYVYYRKMAVGNRFMPSIRVSMNKAGAKSEHESIRVGSYDQIPAIKQQIKDFFDCVRLVSSRTKI